jgi:hypothetical protein
MSSLPVWFIDANGAQGSAVLVWVKKKGAPEARQYLLTAQHVVREEDSRTGPYCTSISAWQEDTGYNPVGGIPVTVDLDLSPDPAQPLVNAEDIAFLELPPGAAGVSPPPLIPFAQCTPTIPGLTIAGYISGNILINIHKNIVKPAVFQGWTYDNWLPGSASGVLTPGSGKPAGGVSGGGVFLDGRYLGVYRGEFENVAQHIFIPVTRIREWCAARGHELQDLSIEGKVEAIEKTIEELHSLKDNPMVKQRVDSSKQEMQTLKNVLAKFRLDKLLHDYLHRMQKQYLNANKAARAAEFDDIAIDDFTTAIRGIKEEVIGVSNTLDELAPGAKKPSWLKGLQDALSQADTASAEQQSAQVMCRKIGTTLRTNLPSINQDLVDGAAEMDLSRLGNLLGDIGRLPSVSSSHSEGLLAGQKTCTDTDAEIKALTAVHHTWQGIDVSLWDAERATLTGAAGGRDEFTSHWNDILKDLTPLLALAAEASWAMALLKLVNKVAALLPGDASWSAMADEFERFARKARERFFDVDQELRNSAQKVATLDKPLESLA